MHKKLRKNFYILIFVFAGLVCYIGLVSGFKDKDTNNPAKVAGQEASDLIMPEERVEQLLKKLNPKCHLHEIEIPNPIKTALKKWDSNFIIWKSSDYSPTLCFDKDFSTSSVLALNAGLGDFNGDRRIDAAIVGHVKTEEAVVVVLSQGKSKYKVFPVCVANESSYKHKLAVLGSCRLMYLREIGELPRVAIYKIISKDKKVEAMASEFHREIYHLKTDAFVVAIKDGYYGKKKRRKPFLDFELFRWDFRFDKKVQEHTKKYPERYIGKEFRTYYPLRFIEE